jgi:hypothetical protein
MAHHVLVDVISPAPGPNGLAVIPQASQDFVYVVNVDHVLADGDPWDPFPGTQSLEAIERIADQEASQNPLVFLVIPRVIAVKPPAISKRQHTKKGIS